MYAVDMYVTCATIDAAPTIETSSIRYGHWVMESENEYCYSECVNYATMSENNKYRHCDTSKFCKECGAKMKLF